MSTADFDAIARQVTPTQLAETLGAKKNGTRWHCPSPHHDDQDPSFSFFSDGGRTAGKCHSCGLGGSPVSLASAVWGVSHAAAAERLVKAIGMPVSAFGSGSGLGEPIETYEYVNEYGKHLFEVVRYAHPKDFRQRVRQGRGWRWKLDGTRRVLYRLPELIEAVALGKIVFVVEGERDVHRLELEGLTATTSAGGAGKWRPEYAESLQGAKVVILGDNDEPGRAHVLQVAQALHRVAEEIRIVELPDLPERGDVSDWLGSGGSAEELKRLVAATSVWRPAAEAPETSDGPGSEHLTDLGNAQRFVRQYGDGLRYVHAWGRWLVWDGKRWAANDRGQVQSLAKQAVRSMHEEALDHENRGYGRKLSKWAFSSESEARIKAMVSLARTERGIAVLPDELDSSPWLFNVQNGTIDLRTGAIRDHDPDDLLTRLTPFRYDPEAQAGRWEEFLLEIMVGRRNLVSFVQRLVGYSMTGLVTEHVLALLHGLGANGKSTLLNVLLDLFGEYGRQAEPDLLIQRRGESHPTGVAALKGARFVATSEIGAGRRMAEALVKSLTGGDRLTARFMRQDFFQFEPTHTLWLAANHKPVVKGTDAAIWRRIHLIPFDATFAVDEQDHELTDKLKTELPGILTWAVRGCLAWQKEGLCPPDAVRAATDSYRDAMDVLAGFFEEACVLEDRAEVEAKELYERYTRWAEESGERRLAKNVFGRQLQERGLEKDKHPKSRRVVYRGIGLSKPFEATRSNRHVNPREERP